MNGTPTQDAMLRLSLIDGLGPILIRRMLAQFGSAENALNASHADLRMIEGIGPKRARDIQDQIHDIDIQTIKNDMSQRGIRILTLDQPEYPRLLKNIHDPPPVLYIRGSLTREDTLGLAIVGARKCTQYGRDQANRFATLSAQAGLCIISGGAYGIDAAAHRGALRAGGRTIAILGCGLAQCYPSDHGPLYDDIANNGAVISELPLYTPPRAENFPARNRIVSGLSLGVLVVEAAARSGALITARLAAEEHHRQVMVIPGRLDSPSSAGCHKIIREGWGALVTNTADVLDELGEAGQMLKDDMISGKQTTTETNRESLFDVTTAEPTSKQTTNDPILDALGQQTLSIDDLVRITGLPIQKIQSQIMTLSLTGQLERLPGNQLRRRS